MVHPVLRPYVESMVAYDTDLGAPGVHTGMPSTTVTFVLPVGQPLDLSWAGDPASRVTQWSTVSGLDMRPAEIHHDGTQHGVQLGLTAAGCRALLGLPAAEVARVMVELGDLPTTGLLADLPERLADLPADDPAARSTLVEDALLDALARHRDAAPARDEIGRALRGLTSGQSVADVAYEVGYSRRHLGTLVREECGVTPKQFQRLARFDLSRRLLQRAARAGRASLAAVGASAGYADQAHLTRDWGELAGCTPTSWLREEFPFLQDPDRSPAAS